MVRPNTNVRGLGHALLAIPLLTSGSGPVKRVIVATFWAVNESLALRSVLNRRLKV